jgi:glutamine amidotransferase
MKSPEITIIDYGLGNLLSVSRGFEHCGAKVKVTSDPKEIINSSRVVLPGVGAFPNAMALLEKYNLIESLTEYGKTGKPLLAICLGMQLLMDESEEFTHTDGLGLIPGRVVSIPSQDSLGQKTKIPHIGWSPLSPSNLEEKWSNTLLKDNDAGDSVYFVHSFQVLPEDPAHEIAYTKYGEHRISSVISKDNVVGCQFHPEKSGLIGLKIMYRFCNV